MDQQTLANAFPASRLRRLQSEVTAAIQKTSSRDMTKWIGRVAFESARVSKRRVGNLHRMGKSLVRAASGESRRIVTAAKNRDGRGYLGSISKRFNSAVSGAKARAITLASGLKSNPKERGIELSVFLIGFCLGSGGFDGDGGIPDSDLLLGIGHHRSVFTHSIVAGISTELAAYAFVDLIRTLHTQFPNDRDPLWDEIMAGSDRIARRFSDGASLGIAYHLGIDATLDGGGTYKGVPVELPLEWHRAFAGANAAVELVDLQVRPGTMIGAYQSYDEASRVAKGAKSTAFQVRRSESGEGFEVIYAPRKN